MGPGSKVKIKRVSVAEARQLQVDHGGFARRMVPMLGGTGLVVGIAGNGAVKVAMDDASGVAVWNPKLVELCEANPTAGGTSSSPRSATTQRLVRAAACLVGLQIRTRTGDVLAGDLRNVHI